MKRLEDTVVGCDWGLVRYMSVIRRDRDWVTSKEAARPRLMEPSQNREGRDEIVESYRNGKRKMHWGELLEWKWLVVTC